MSKKNKITITYRPELPNSRGLLAIEPLQFGKIQIDEIKKGFTITNDFKIAEVDCRIICTDYGILKTRNFLNVENHVMQVSFGNGNFKQRWFTLNRIDAKIELSRQITDLSESLINEMTKIDKVYNELLDEYK